MGIIREIMDRLRSLSHLRNIKAIRLTVDYDDGSMDVIHIAKGKVTLMESHPSHEERELFEQWTEIHESDSASSQ